MSDIADRLARLRRVMKEQQLDAVVIPRADEYLGEYIPAHNERLRWISGFTGSAGMAVVLENSAAVFTDGRYTVQVRQQVDEDLFSIHHLIENPPAEWLKQQLSSGQTAGVDARTVSVSWFENTRKVLEGKEVRLQETDGNLVDLCWDDRPEPVVTPASPMPDALSGCSSMDKRRQVGQLIREQNADAALIFASDSCNWLLNLRGRDIPSLPMVLGIGLLHSNGVMVFHCDLRKLPVDLKDHVGPGVVFREEAALGNTLSELNGRRVLLDRNTSNAWCQLKLEQQGAIVIPAADPVLIPKARKNEVEISGFKAAHLRDAVAEIRFLHWLDEITAAGQRPDEAELSDQLLAFRQEQEGFVDVSFDTISAAGSNAAMCHYNHLNGKPAPLPENGLYLVDSGAQYEDGTTDITRTVAIGQVDESIRFHFTLVLKGHIALARAVFPEGTNGAQLDTFARQFLWQEGLDFDHGTGHGVGHFLSVHEGPQRISKKGHEVAFEEGMVVSNEPGFYLDGRYGIRCENLQVVVCHEELSQNGRRFFAFEPLTLVPFDRRLIQTSLLSSEELRWLNDYHEMVRRRVMPLLPAGCRRWMEAATAPLAASWTRGR